MAKTGVSKNLNKPFARVIESNVVDSSSPLHWLALALKDFARAPAIALAYGALFSIIPIAICLFVISSSNHLVILPATIAFALIGPAFATGLYDVAWELEKGHTPTFRHSLKSMFRNPVGEWGFAIVLFILMVAWTRVAALIHVLYPSATNPTFEELLAFLTLGSIAGACFLVVVFGISAFTPQIVVERRVDIMTAVVSSLKAVHKNPKAMFTWGLMIICLVGFSILTLGFGFIVIMPILAFASWHAYIAVIKTKRPRSYE